MDGNERYENTTEKEVTGIRQEMTNFQTKAHRWKTNKGHTAHMSERRWERASMRHWDLFPIRVGTGFRLKI